MTETVRVVSWNIRHGIEVDVAVDELRKVHELARPDLLLLQEMDERGTARIADALDADHVFHSVTEHRKSARHFGNAIVSPWPIADAGELALPHVAPVGGHPRAAVRANVSVAGREVLAYSVHTETAALRLSRRVEQFQRVADDVRDRRATHVVVGGDFNTVTARGVDALSRALSTAGLRRASIEAGASFRRAGREVSLDHLFVTGLEPRSVGVVTSTAASDHRPLWAELAIAGGPSAPTA